MNFDPLQIQLFYGVFQSICEEMGTVLQKTAYSPNIKERRDFSCALFNENGELLAQAAHIPVHLGSAQRSVQAAISSFHMKPGDMVILNDPYSGGTHLPDFTLIAPVFSSEPKPKFYIANRAHHADIGGIVPGSIPLAKHIDEEGARLGPSLFMEHYQLVNETMSHILEHSRTPEERRGDLQAQITANKFGENRLSEIIKRYGMKQLRKQSQQIHAYGQKMMEMHITKITDGTYSFEDYLEHPDAESGQSHQQKHLIKISVQIIIDREKAKVDFSKSDTQNLETSLNTVISVTEAAVLYAFRSTSREDFPVNAGCLRPIQIIAPPGCIVNATEPAAVSAGNVETSQRIVDVVLGALSKAMPDRIPAASCGSMNNICIGGEYPDQKGKYTYYETLAGGQGALPYADGQSAIQTHMTNTLNTPVETLEHNYPFQVDQYQIRNDSGGDGLFRGGNGMIRRYSFHYPAQVTLVTERRIYPPYGLNGGHDGQTGENILIRNGETIALPGKVSLQVDRGDAIEIRTPGGGGFGRKFD